MLDHQCGPGSHFDWMIEDPSATGGEALLCTWRVASAPDQWAKLGRIELTRLGDHRRAYLTYEGELTGGRGHVHRLDEGEAAIVSWTPDAAELDLTLRSFTGRITMRQDAGTRWVMHVTG